ncbi:RNA-binding protein YlmH [Aequitasia blattaphilus]|uniref:YlmH/Sll1252 family protein n=1 Tax=Aequitasia blattaphilus TaxID=2949332 RepID=A0ABT1E7E6_9FIRM|nr:YlmH/Sll1252 family protein [Aequitasia blattaphilus]MCP1101703.1 YlmH/Sll1252 family protein [Aequitasia blattaphilus]MCR8614343.1 YlmH/Sll1252 family protein [Aequitasia blattaphilus]
MNKEEQMIQNRLIELSNVSYHKNIVMFSDFLNLNELHILNSINKSLLPTQYKTFGGYKLAERQMVAFLPDALCYEYNYPIKILRISPVNKRFAENLSHRDYLGSLMNLGIERSNLGDIIMAEEGTFLFVSEKLSSYITDELTRVRHTTVIVREETKTDFTYEPSFELIKGSVASIRLDTVLTLAFPLSRSKITLFIQEGRTFVNGKLVTNNGHPLKEGDLITLRKMGRVQYLGILSETKKKRQMIQIRKYL